MIMKKNIGVVILILSMASGMNCAFAEELKLSSNDGSTKFTVRDQAAAAVFSADSDGNTVIGGTAAVTGSAFSVGGSTLVVKAGKVGIGTAAPVAALDVNGGVRVGNYVSASTPSPAGLAGTFIFNTTLGRPYVSDGTAWKPLNSDSDGDGVTDAVDTDDNNAADANAAVADILAGKTFYAGGAARTGSMPVQALNSASNSVSAGYYAATTLSAADADLAAGNVKSGVTIFGIAGTAVTAPPAPGVGGTWLLVPGNSSLGTMDFYVQKYEAKNVSSLPTSQPSGSPWVSITQTESKNRCEALGPGYHLLTMAEAQTISRNIEAIGWNWDSGSVGTGGMWRGHTDNAPANSLAADVTGDPDDDYYIGTGQSGTSIERRVHQLSSGQYLWDWSGNVWEWVDMTCTAGTGAGYWYNSGSWIEWDNANLSDYEKGRAGPAGAYTATQNAGRYYGCTATGNAVFRGGNWSDGALAGVFAFYAVNAPSNSYTNIGFRCGR